MAIDIGKIKQVNSEKSKSNFFDFLNYEFKFNSVFNDKKKERFFSDLSILLSSGIDLKTALEIIVSEYKKGSELIVIENIKNEVLNGVNLSEAIKNSNKFSNYEYYSIKIGEESGRLSIILNELTLYYAKKIKQKRHVISVLSYPIMVFTVTIGVMVFMLNFIVPLFKDIFSKFDSELPPLTKFIIDLSEAFSKYSLFIVLVLVSIILFLWFQLKAEWYRAFFSKIVLKIPFFGNMIKKVYISRFCQSMSLLITSKIPLLDSIELVKNIITFYPLEKALIQISTEIIKGNSLNKSMANFEIFDKRLITLIKVAEEVNQLDQAFDRLNKQYADDIEHNLSILNSIIEPILIVFIGGIVATILIAMYMPLFQLSTSVY